MNRFWKRRLGRLIGRLFLVLWVGFIAGCAGAPPLPISQVDGAPVGDIAYSLFLIGDAGKPAANGEPVLEGLTQQVGACEAEAAVVFLGDNIYQRGLPDSTSKKRAEGERRIDDQIQAVLDTDATGIFVPGNHDWDRSGDDGWQAIRRQQRYIDRLNQPRITFLPKGGCPGPSVVDLGAELRLVILDTQWWLHGGPKPEDASSGCPTFTEDAIIDSLGSAMAGAGGRHVIVVAHHPPVSGGTHGGHFTWVDHIFPLTRAASWAWLPLPIIGSAYPLSRQWGITNQDQSSSAYKRMLEAFDEVFVQYPPLVFAGGHQHTLEVYNWKTAKSVLVSGAGVYGHNEPTSYRHDARYAVAKAGFMRLDLLRNGSVRLGVYLVDESGDATESYSLYLN